MKKELKGLDGRVAIHCVTPELYTQVLDFFPMDAEKRKSMDFGFGKYGDETCVDNVEGLGYGEVYFYISEGYTIISASEFIAMNTAPEPAPAWTFKTDEELKSFVAKFLSSNCDNFVQFLASLRKPAFELVTADNVKVTDRNQVVWIINGDQIVQYDACFVGVRQCFSTEQAALDYRFDNTPAIKLSDMTLEDVADGHYYVIKKEDAHNLVNERINGK